MGQVFYLLAMKTLNRDILKIFLGDFMGDLRSNNSVMFGINMSVLRLIVLLSNLNIY